MTRTHARTHIRARTPPPRIPRSHTISLYLSVSVCLSDSISVCLSVRLSLCLSLSLSLSKRLLGQYLYEEVSSSPPTLSPLLPLSPPPPPSLSCPLSPSSVKHIVLIPQILKRVMSKSRSECNDLCFESNVSNADCYCF